MDQIVLSEPLHTVIQGEGELIGRKMLLIRVHGCPLKCKSCDSFHTWDEKRLSDSITTFSIEELATIVKQKLVMNNLNTVMITGGEPQLYRRQIANLVNLIQKLSSRVIYFDIETTGLVSWPESLIKNDLVHFDLSPKIGSLKSKLKTDSWKLFLEKPRWYDVKVVTSRKTFKEDLKQIKSFQKQYSIPSRKIYLMPMGTTREEMINESSFVIDKCFKHKFEFSPRLHLFVYDSKRLV